MLQEVRINTYQHRRIDMAQDKQQFRNKKRISDGDKILRKYRKAMVRKAEYIKLKSIVPSVANKKTVTKLTVIEEAIKYINELHGALAEKLNEPTLRSSTILNEGFNPAALFLQPLVAQNFFNNLHRNSANYADNFESLSPPHYINNGTYSPFVTSRITSYTATPPTSSRTPLSELQQQRHRHV